MFFVQIICWGFNFLFRFFIVRFWFFFLYFGISGFIFFIFRRYLLVILLFFAHIFRRIWIFILIIALLFLLICFWYGLPFLLLFKFLSLFLTDSLLFLLFFHEMLLLLTFILIFLPLFFVYYCLLLSLLCFAILLLSIFDDLFVSSLRPTFLLLLVFLIFLWCFPNKVVVLSRCFELLLFELLIFFIILCIRTILCTVRFITITICLFLGPSFNFLLIHKVIWIVIIFFLAFSDLLHFINSSLLRYFFCLFPSLLFLFCQQFFGFWVKFNFRFVFAFFVFMLFWI